MSDHLVLIQTYHDFFQADEAQSELDAAGIYSILVAQDEPSPVGLAVIGRDAEIATRVLCHPVHPVG